MSTYKQFGESDINGRIRNKVGDFSIEWFPKHPFLTALVSIFLNVLIAITGILPSAFITVGTVGILGFRLGLVILIIGEAIGAMVSFILYRKGVHKLSTYPDIKKFDNKLLRRLKSTGGAEAFFIVILLRVLPFVPSGLVTLTAAISKMNFLHFSIASTIGKIPALYIEAFTVFQVLNLKTEWKLGFIISVLLIIILYLLWKSLIGKK